MSEPITDLDVLNREYAVEGGEWLIGDPDYQEPADDDDEPGKPTLCLRGRDWQIWEGEDGWTDMDGTPSYKAFVAWGCAHLGIPTPWRAAERMETFAAVVHGAGASALVLAARMLQGKSWSRSSLRPSMSGSITPERIAEARAATQPCGASWLRFLLRDVLVDRDHHVARADAAEAEAEASRLRELMASSQQ